jgi:hypothetical protein
MSVIFHSKNILTNSKTIWIIILFSLIFFSSCARRNAAVVAQRKTEKIRVQQQKETEAGIEKARKRHFNMQTKKVQERMKADEKKTKEYYNKKTERSFFSMLFGKKKRR